MTGNINTAVLQMKATTHGVSHLIIVYLNHLLFVGGLHFISSEGRHYSLMRRLDMGVRSTIVYSAVPHDALGWLHFLLL